MNLDIKCRVLKVAVDYDNEFSQLGGGSKALAIMQEVDRIYTKEVNLRVNVCYLEGWISSTPGYPYNTNTPNNLNAILFNVSAKFWNHWNTNRGNVARDCAHLFTGKSLTDQFGTPNANGEATGVPIGSTQKSYSLSDAGNGSTDWEAVAAHEIGHNLGHPMEETNCSNTLSIMCQGNNKDLTFSQSSKDIINPFLNNNMTLGPRVPSIKPQLNFQDIYTPAFISSNGKTLNIVNNDPLIFNNTFTYSVNNSLVQFNQSANPTFIKPNGAPHFTFTIKYTNTCGSFYRSIPLIATSNALTPTLYPNPNNGNLLIDFKNEGFGDMRPREIKVYSEAQNLIYSETIQSNDTLSESKTSAQLKIDLQNQPLGRYFVILFYPDGTTKKYQIILEK